MTHTTIRTFLLTGAATACLIHPALATDTVVTSAGRTTALTLGGTDTLTVQSNGVFTSTSNPTLTIGQGTGMVVNNSGTIQSTAGGGSRAIRLTGANGQQHTVTINNLAGGLIQTDGDAIQANNNYPTGPIIINNAGTIQSTGTGANNGQALDFASLATNTPNLVVNNAATGLIQAADADAIRGAAGAVINNYGQITSNFSLVSAANGNASGNDAIDYQSNIGGAVNNYAGGVISGAKNGVTGKYALSITNAGTITGRDGSGINIDTALDASPAGLLADTGIVTIVNTGTIIGNAVSADGDAIDVDYLASIVNSGTIRAVGKVDPSVGSLNEALAIGGGSLVNNAGGLVISDERAITVDDSNLGNAFGAMTIDNAGTITGSNGQAIKITSILANSLINRATGVINGSVVMGAGADTVTLYAGQVLNGTLDGGAGADILNLMGPGNGSLTGVSNFETLNLAGGTWSLAGNQSYATAVNVTGGTLRANGTLATGALTVANGATLTPGAATDTLTVNGRLVLSRGATTAVSVTPSSAGRINVSGTAALDGTLLIAPAAGNYSVGTRYTVLSATGGITGQFAATSMTGAAYFKPRLGYDANNAYLYLDQVALGGIASGATGNQGSVAHGIDAAIAAGVAPGTPFQALFGLSGAALNNALDQISGQTNAGIAQAMGASSQSFITTMLTDGISPNGDGGVQPAQLTPDRLRLWGAVFGGHAGLSANGGAAALNASSVGGAGGVESQFTDGTAVGVSLGFANQDFGAGNGTGDSSDVQLGVYGRTGIFDAGYLAGAFAYGWHDITTTRTLTVSGLDVLGAQFDATEISGRIEAGWRIDLDEAARLTPYAAFSADSFDAPAYGETARAGSGVFALNYAANATDQNHFELGARLGSSLAVENGLLSLEASIAWSHLLDDTALSVAAFQGLPGSSFAIYGATPAQDTALLGLGLSLDTGNGFAVGVRANGQVGEGTTIMSGSGTLSWRW